jgi:hypothetical protein
MSNMRIGWTFVAIGLGLVGLWGGRVLHAGLQLRADVRALERALWSEGPPDLRGLCEAAGRSDRSLRILQEEAGFLVRLAAGLREDWQSLPSFLTAARHLAAAGEALCAALGPDPEALSGAASSWERALVRLSESQEALRRAAAEASAARAAWRQVRREGLPPALRPAAARLEEGLPMLEAGLQLTALLPDLLGMEGPRTYLILAQNEDELRPTGGFLTGVGEVRLDRGRITSIVFYDSYAVDDFSRPYPDPPAPLREYMGIDLWVFRDSNWSPDFPTSARQALSLYRPGRPVAVDGVLALDQRALQEIVRALGPLRVEGHAEPITGENVLAYIRRAWAPEGGQLTPEWWRRRKSFMEPLAHAIRQRLEESHAVQGPFLRALFRLLQEKHLLLYFTRPEAQAALASLGWDGSLRRGEGDFWMAVDANVGYNKANARVRQAFLYEVDLDREPSLGRLTIVYTHTAPPGYPCVPEIRYDAIYERMMDRCYWDYLRVFIPWGSRLMEDAPVPVPASALRTGRPDPGSARLLRAEEGPFAVVATLLVIPPGAVQARSFAWTLSPTALRWEGEKGCYTLRVPKQPGTTGHPLRVRVRFPPDWVLEEAEPVPAAVAEGHVEFQTRLDQDRGFRACFRRVR